MSRTIATEECDTFDDIRKLLQRAFDEIDDINFVLAPTKEKMKKQIAIVEAKAVAEARAEAAKKAKADAEAKEIADARALVAEAESKEKTEKELAEKRAFDLARARQVLKKAGMAIIVFAVMFLFGGSAQAKYVATDINSEIAANHDLLAEYLRDSFANITSNSFLFTPTDTVPPATEGTVYYGDSAKNLILRTDDAWVDIDVSGASSLDAAYSISAAIVVDNGAVTLTGSDSDSNILLALVQNDTNAGVAALTVGSAGNAAAIIIAQTGSGGDIQGTAGWSVDATGVGTFLSFVLENSETIDNTDDGEITFGDGSADTAISWSGTTLEWTTDTSVDTVSWGDLDDHTGLRNITFDVDEKGYITLAGTGTADDLTIQQTTSGQNASLILQSTGTGDDALTLITTVADISLVSASDITRTAAANITDVTTDGAYTLTIGGSTNGKFISTVADTYSLVVVDTIGISNTEASKDITVDSTAGSVIIDGGEAIADAVTIQAPAGGVDITAAATFDIDLTATGGTVQVIASEAAANQFKVDATGVTTGFAIVFETTDGAIQIHADGGTNGDITADAASVLTLIGPSIVINEDLSTNTTDIGTGTTTGTVTLGGTGTQAIDVGTGAGIKTVTVGSTTTTSATTVQSGSGDLTLTSTDAITMTSAGVFGIGANSVAQTITVGNETGATALHLLAGTGDIDIQGVAASTIDIGDAAQTAAITIGASTATMTDLSLGTGVGAHTIHIGDGGVATQAITMGSASSASAITIQSGTGDVNITSTDDLNVGANSAAQDVVVGNQTSTSSLKLYGGTGDIVIEGVAATTIDIGDAAQTAAITIGASTATMTDLSLGTGVGAHTIHIGDGGVAAQVITIGSNSVASSVSILAGTGDFSVDGVAAATYTIGNAAQTGTMKFGESSSTGQVNIGTGTGVHTLNLATGGSGAKTINVGDGASTGTTTILSGSGGLNINVDNNQATNIGSGSTTGTITIGGAGAQTIAIGTGAAIKGVTVGSTDTSSGTTIQSGTADLSLTSTDDLTMTASGAVNICANAVEQTVTIGNTTSASSLALKVGTGNFTLEGVAGSTFTLGLAAQTGTMKFGESSAAGSVDIGTGTGVRTVTVGGTTGAAATTIQSGTGDLALTSTDDITMTASGDLNIGANAVEQLIEIGNATSGSSLDLKAGTGNFTVDGVAATTYTIGNSSQTGTMKFGESDATMILNLGTGTGAHTIHIGDGGTSAQLVTIGSTSGASAVTIQSGTGKLAMSSTNTANDAILINASATGGGILFNSNNLDQKIITMRISAGVVTASEIMIDAPGAPYICTGLEAGIAETGAAEGKVTCADDADTILFSIQLPELMYDTDTITDLVLEFDIQEVDAGGTVDVLVYQYGDTSAEITDTITIANAAARAWVGLTTLSSGIGGVGTIDQGDVFLVSLSPGDATSDFDLWGVRLTYRVGIDNTD